MTNLSLNSGLFFVPNCNAAKNFAKIVVTRMMEKVNNK